MEIKEKVEKHKKLSLHYYENALHFIESGDAEKASEFLWGSMAQALKSVAASKDIALRRHNDIRNYALELTRYLKDESIRHAFINAQSLHSNFYESGLILDDVKQAAEDVKAVEMKLFNLIDDKNASSQETSK